MSNEEMVKIVRRTLHAFCTEFLRNPYLCYTEHGQHALFFGQLLAALPLDQQYQTRDKIKVCTVQKEYPTADKLGKPRRQHWDIAVLKRPLTPVPGKAPWYDYLALDAVVEFGLNADLAHFEEDLRRLNHQDSQVAHGFIVHLQRISNGFSGRDSSPTSKLLHSADDLQKTLKSHDPSGVVDVFFARFDGTSAPQSGAWHITTHEIASICQNDVSPAACPQP
jgi:hypothetical protein